MIVFLFHLFVYLVFVYLCTVFGVIRVFLPIWRINMFMIADPNRTDPTKLLLLLTLVTLLTLTLISTVTLNVPMILTV